MDGGMNGCDGWTDGWMDVWIGWMDGWMEQRDLLPINYLSICTKQDFIIAIPINICYTGT